MKLVIIESPNKIKKLKSILSSEYEIVASIGHLFDLPKKELGVDLETFDLDLVLDENKKDILSNIKKLSDEAEIIYLASDGDREGSSISKNIFDALTKKNQKKCKRLLINAITKEAVEKAIKNPTDLNLNLSDAQKGRRATDRLVGYKISPIMWNKGLKGTSAGRVQSVALKYVSDLEKEILAFKPEEYWKTFLECDGFKPELSSVDDKSYNPESKEIAEKMKKDILSGIKSAKVIDYINKTRTRSPEPPFITSTMQQVASSQFGWNAQKVMQVAQTLFSSGQISYHRSDSVRIEQDKIDSIRKKILSSEGSNYLSPSQRFYQNKDASQDAHEAIRPTYDTPISTLSSDEQRLLKLIDSRFRASQMADAIFDQAQIKIEIKSSKHTYVFKINGSIMTFDGFLKVYGDNKEDITLPKLTVGSSVDVKNIIISQHFTQPPGRYSDASIIKKLEKDGIGRPSTYASIIETILKRGYVERDKKAIKATELGMLVSDYLTVAFPDLISTEMTANMELSLDKIAEGKVTYKEVMEEFWKSLSDSISIAKKADVTSVFKVDRKCPKCESDLIKKKSSDNIFLGCSSWPKCGYTVKIDEDGNEDTSEVEETGEECPECGGILKQRKSKFGKIFFGCGNYPNCKYIKKEKSSSNTSASEITKIKCTKCKDSLMRKITLKDGSQFLGCCSYPKCKVTMNLDKNGIIIKYK